MGIHREGGNQTAFNQRVRIMAHDFTIFTGTRLGFIRVHDQIRRTAITFLWHKGPLQPGWKSRPAAAAQPGGLHLIDDPIAALFDQSGRAIPMATRLGTFQCALMHPIEIGENTILIFQHVI